MAEISTWKSPFSSPELMPLAGDTVKFTAPKNSYLKGTYTYDPEALKNQIGQYSSYDSSQLGDLKNYVSPLAKVAYNDQLYMKPEDFNKAVANFDVVDPSSLNDDFRNVLNSVVKGKIGNGQVFTDKGAYDAALNNTYSFIDSSKLAPEIWNEIKNGGLKQWKDTTYYTNKDNLGNITGLLSNYAALPQSTWDKYKSYADNSGLKPIVNSDGTILLKKDQLENLAQGYNIDDYVKKLGLKNESGTPLTSEEFWNTYGTTPEGGWTDANTKGGWLKLFSKGLTNSGLKSWQNDTSKLPNFSLYGSGSPEDIKRGFNVLQRMSPQNINEFWYLDPETQKGILQNPGVALQQMRALANPANKDWLSIGAEGGYNSINAYKWNPKTGLIADPTQYKKINNGGGFLDDVLGFDPNGGGIHGSFVGEVLDNPIVNTVLSVVPVTAPYMAAYNALNAASMGDIGGAVLSGLGGYLGATGVNPSSALGSGVNSALNLGLGSAGQAALGGALYGAGMGALRGGNLNNVMSSALVGGLGSYGSNYLSNNFSNASPMAKYALTTGLQSGLGGLSAVLNGGDLRTGVTSGALSGVAGSLSNSLANSVGGSYGKTLGTVSNPIIRQMLTNQLYKR